MATLEGGCLCGNIRYRASEALLTILCHCRNCQRQSGAAFSVNVMTSAGSVEVSGNIKTFRDHGDTGVQVDRQFCPQCGSALITRVEAYPDILVLKAGTLDDPGAAGKPAAEIYCDRAFSWTPPVADKRFERGAEPAQLFA